MINGAVRRRGINLLFILGLILVIVCAPTPSQVPGITSIISSSPAFGDANADVFMYSISADGRYIAFYGWASNLVANDTNGMEDVFVSDRLTGITILASVDSIGTQGNGSSAGGLLSADGRYLAFTSYATNLVPGDTNGAADAFVRDLTTGITERVSVTSAGIEANGWSGPSGISADGRYVVFLSNATNLVPNDTNGVPDAFVRDRLLGITERVDVSSAGIEATHGCISPVMSSDGRYVAFHSDSANLVSGDTNGSLDTFVHDRLTGLTQRVSISTSGLQGNNTIWQGQYSAPSISGNGRYVAFDSGASNLVPNDTNGQNDVFLRDRLAGTTIRVSVGPFGGQGNYYSAGPSLSDDARYVVFISAATNFVLGGDGNGANDCFVHDNMMGTTVLISTNLLGAPGNGESSGIISADGASVAFESTASDLVPDGQPSSIHKVFVRGLRPWNDLHSALPGTSGTPVLDSFGPLIAGSPGSIHLRHARPNSVALLSVSSNLTPFSFMGGVVLAWPPAFVLILGTSASGETYTPFVWPVGVPAGSTLVLQYGIQDVGAIQGFALSNAVAAVTP